MNVWYVQNNNVYLQNIITPTIMKSKYIISFLLLLSFCYANAQQKNQSANTRRDTVVIGGDWNFPPYDYINENNQPEGFTIDLLTTILQRMDTPYKIVVKDWATTQDEVIKGHIDIVCMAFNNRRAQYFKFGEIICFVPKYIVCRNGDNRMNRFSDMKGKTIAVQKGSSAQDILMKEKRNIKIVLINDILPGLKELATGKYDGLLCDYDAALFYIKKYGLDNLKAEDIGIPPLEYSLTGLDEDLLNKMGRELYEMKRDGTYQTLHDKWFKDLEKSNLLKVIYLVVGLLVFLALSMTIIITVFKKKIEHAKKILKDKSEELNRKIDIAITSGNIVFWEFNRKEGYIMSYNDPLAGEQKYLKAKIEDFLKYVHTEDRDHLNACIKRLQAGENKVISADIRIKAATDKNWKYITITSTPVKTDPATGLVDQFVGIRKDNTEIILLNKKVNEYAKKINFVLLNGKMLTWTYEIENDLFSVYIEGDKLYNMLSSQEYIKRCEPEDRDTASATINLMKKGLLPSISTRRKVSLSNNTADETYYNIIGVSLRNDNDQTTGYFGLCNDVTDLIQTQHKLQTEMEKAQEADKLKSEFVANMSHEIRTPLNSIVGFSSIMENLTDPNEKEQCMNLINKNNDMLLHLINDILDLSRIESGAMSLDNTDFDLSALLSDVYQSLKEQNKNNEIELKYDKPYASCIVHADPNRISQIITNFVTNAFKYTERGYIRISYECINGGVKLLVEDTGCGIPENKLSSVFERFEKLGSLKQGAGLGLSICKAIADMYKGNVGVNSVLGKGSTFWVWLPLEADI